MWRRSSHHQAEAGAAGRTQRMGSFVPENVHLVGSIGLDSVPEVFRVLGQSLGRRLRRVPDGEVGGRRLWISWQYPLFRANPFLAVTETARPRTAVSGDASGRRRGER